MPDEEISLRNWFVPLTNRKIYIFLIFIGFVLYLSGLLNGFVGDDNTQIVDNPALRNIQNLPAFFLQNRLDVGGVTKLGATYYKPLLDTTYLFLYQIFGLNPFWYHFTQLLLYLLTTCLVFLFFKKFFTLRLSFLLSLLFLVHPINTETVLYTADLQDILFFLFGIVSILLIHNKMSLRREILIGFFLLLSLFSKETGILFVVIIPMYVKLFYNKFFLKIVGVSLSSLFIYGVMRLHAIGLFTNHLISAPIQKLDLPSRILNAPEIIFFYIKTFIFPVKLSSSWQWVVTKMDIQQFILPLIFLLVFVCFFIYFFYKLKKTNKKLTTYFLFFIVWLSSGLLFHLHIIALDQTVAERWFYFSMISMLGILGLFIEYFKLKLNSQWVVTICICILLLLSFRTWVRTFDYRNDFTLAFHDEKVTSDSYNLEYMLSHEYYSAGYLKLALVHANRSVSLFPYITNYTNLGAIKSQMGDYKGAKDAYQKALQYGENALPYENLSSLALVYGDPKINIDFIKNVALKKFPQNQRLHTNLALLEYIYGNKDVAKQEINKAQALGENSYTLSIKQLFDAKKPLRIIAKNGMIIFDTTSQK